MPAGLSGHDAVTIPGVVQGEIPLVFEGKHSDGNQLQLGIEHLTAPRKVWLPDRDGQILVVPGKPWVVC